MSEWEQIHRMIDTMPEYRIVSLLAFLQAFADSPNAETRLAMDETDEMIRTGGGQHFQGKASDFFAMLDAPVCT